MKQRRYLSLMRIECCPWRTPLSGSSRLPVPDSRVFPIRGEVLQVARAAIATETILLHEEDDLMTYIVPRGQDCVLGGTAEDGNWDRRPNPENGRRILERCTQLRAELADASGVTHRVGLRPGRDEVRLELEELPDRTAIIHNYGHGGAGFTLAWGCADEVADLARSVRERPPASDGRLQAN